MTATTNEAHEAVLAFAQAAERLLNVWTRHDTPPAVDDLLTLTYPINALPMSFDEIVAELWAWEEATQ